MIGNRNEEEARPSDLGHTRHGPDLDGTGPGGGTDASPAPRSHSRQDIAVGMPPIAAPAESTSGSYGGLPAAVERISRNAREIAGFSCGFRRSVRIVASPLAVIDQTANA